VAADWNARARFYACDRRRAAEREAEQLRELIASERAAMREQLANVQANIAKRCAEVQPEPAETKAELARLRALHAQVQQERESIWRDRMWTDAMLAQRDPTAPLQ